MLKSYSHNIRVAKKLGWETKHFVEGRLNRKEEYKPLYYSVEFDKDHLQLLAPEFRMELQPDVFILSFEREDLLSTYDYSEGLSEAISKSLT